MIKVFPKMICDVFTYYSSPLDRQSSLSKRRRASHVVEPMAGFEPATSSLPRKCSTPELHRHCVRFERKTGLKPAALSLEG